MELVICFGRVVATSAHLVGKVELVLLLFGLENIHQVKSILSQDHVATISQIRGDHLRFDLVKRRNHTC